MSQYVVFLVLQLKTLLSGREFGVELFLFLEAGSRQDFGCEIPVQGKEHHREAEDAVECNDYDFRRVYRITI